MNWICAGLLATAALAVTVPASAQSVYPNSNIATTNGARPYAYRGGYANRRPYSGGRSAYASPYARFARGRFHDF